MSYSWAIRRQAHTWSHGVSPLSLDLKNDQKSKDMTAPMERFVPDASSRHEHQRTSYEESYSGTVPGPEAASEASVCGRGSANMSLKIGECCTKGPL